MSAISAKYSTTWISTNLYLVDANVLLYATDSSARHHDACRHWLEESLNGQVRVGLPVQSLAAFLRIGTHPRIMANPLEPHQAWAIITEWLDAPTSWIPDVTARTVDLLGTLVVEYEVTGNLVTDAQIAAQAIEYGLTVATLDTDFARFPIQVLDPRSV